MSLSYQEQRLAGYFCDAVLKVQGEEFQVHKVILCKCSKVFRALFNLCFPLDQKDFVIYRIKAEYMALILDHAYTDSCSMTTANVQELMSIAYTFDMMDLVQACSLFIKQQLCPGNCIKFWQFTLNGDFPDLESNIFRYILIHFQEVYANEEFPQLTADELGALINEDGLIVGTENMVFEAIMRWINHMPQQRKRHIRELMSKIRLCLMGEKYLVENVRTNDHVKTNNSCLAMVSKACRLLSQNSHQRSILGFSHRFFRQRLPSSFLLATGGWSRSAPTNVIQAYDTRINNWVHVDPSAERPRAYHGTAFLDGFIYYIGGYDGEMYFSSVRRFDPIRTVWEDVPMMNECRCYVSVTTLNGFIYAMGGRNANDRLRSAERYDPQTNEWNNIASMHEVRSDASCATFLGMIYVCGGFTGFEVLGSAEYYNSRTDQWTRISPMTSLRSGLGVVACRGCLYAVGGNDGSNGDNRLRSVEVYNPSNATWTEVSPMITTRSNFGIGAVEDCILVAGGYDGVGTSTAVESYDATLDVWTAARNMSIPRSALSCCVVSGLPDMREFTVNRDSLRIEEEFDNDDEY